MGKLIYFLLLTMVLVILIGGSYALIYIFYAKKSEPISMTQTTQPLTDKQTPLEVVKIYVDFSVAGDLDSVRKYTTGYPQEFYDSKDKEVILYRESKGEIMKKEPVSTPENDSESRLKIIIPNESTKLINKSGPEILKQNDVYIDEVKNIWTKDSEARVRVVLRSKIKDKYKAVEDFLLYQKNGEWKTFHFESPLIFNVYGIPDEDDYKYVK